jgi:hypothetical protein
MPSLALQEWSADRAAALDEIEHAHRSVGGTGPGRRTLTQQINQAYAMLLASQFQGFCRDLHGDCVGRLVASVVSPVLQAAYRRNLLFGRKLDTGNPNSGNIGSDFNRLGLSFCPAVEADHPRNRQRGRVLETLNRWRNAIAHDAFPQNMYRGAILPCISRRFGTGGGLVTAWAVRSRMLCTPTCFPLRRSRPGIRGIAHGYFLQGSVTATDPRPISRGRSRAPPVGADPRRRDRHRGSRQPRRGGERIYRVRVRLDDVSEPMETEEPADELTLVARAPTRSRKRKQGKRAGGGRVDGPAEPRPGTP